VALKLVKSLSILAGIAAIGTASFAMFMDGATGNLKEILNIPATGLDTMGALFMPLVFMFFFLYWISNH
jgi:hypothetical protein